MIFRKARRDELVLMFKSQKTSQIIPSITTICSHFWVLLLRSLKLVYLGQFKQRMKAENLLGRSVDSATCKLSFFYGGWTKLCWSLTLISANLGYWFKTLGCLQGEREGNVFIELKNQRQKDIPCSVHRNHVGSNIDKSMSHIFYMQYGAYKWAVKYSCWSMSHQLHVSGQSNPA